jgi:hypothetical protein
MRNAKKLAVDKHPYRRNTKDEVVGIFAAIDALSREAEYDCTVEDYFAWGASMDVTRRGS